MRFGFLVLFPKRRALKGPRGIRALPPKRSRQRLCGLRIQIKTSVFTFIRTVDQNDQKGRQKGRLANNTFVTADTVRFLEKGAVKETQQSSYEFRRRLLQEEDPTRHTSSVEGTSSACETQSPQSPKVTLSVEPLRFENHPLKVIKTVLYFVTAIEKMLVGNQGTEAERSVWVQSLQRLTSKVAVFRNSTNALNGTGWTHFRRTRQSGQRDTLIASTTSGDSACSNVQHLQAALVMLIEMLAQEQFPVSAFDANLDDISRHEHEPASVKMNQTLADVSTQELRHNSATSEGDNPAAVSPDARRTKAGANVRDRQEMISKKGEVIKLGGVGTNLFVGDDVVPTQPLIDTDDDKSSDEKVNPSTFCRGPTIVRMQL